MSRCLPRDTTDSIARPATLRLSSTRFSAGNIDAKRATVCPAFAAWSSCALRKMESPSGIDVGRLEPECAGDESGFEQKRGKRVRRRIGTVDFLDQHAVRRFRAG